MLEKYRYSSKIIIKFSRLEGRDGKEIDGNIKEKEKNLECKKRRGQRNRSKKEDIGREEKQIEKRKEQEGRNKKELKEEKEKGKERKKSEKKRREEKRRQRKKRKKKK